MGTVLMTGRVKDVEEIRYKVPLVFSYKGEKFLIIKKQTGDLIQFSASILGTSEQGRQFSVSISVFSECRVSRHGYLVLSVCWVFAAISGG